MNPAENLGARPNVDIVSDNRAAFLSRSAQGNVLIDFDVVADNASRVNNDAHSEVGQVNVFAKDRLIRDEAAEGDSIDLLEKKGQDRHMAKI